MSDYFELRSIGEQLAAKLRLRAEKDRTGAFLRWAPDHDGLMADIAKDRKAYDSGVLADLIDNDQSLILHKEKSHE
jgi:hypothetical protein